MNICIFGAGAVGSHVAARLAAEKTDTVSVVARGAHLKAIRERGITLRSNDAPEITSRPDVATDDPSTLPPQDLLLVTLKACALPGAADTLARLLAPEGCAVFLNNGIPWWWPYGLPGDRGRCHCSIPKGRSGPGSGSGRWAASSIRPMKSSNRAWSCTAAAAASPSASPTGL